MDAGDFELFERGVRHAVEQNTGSALDGALRDLGWSEAFADDPGPAVRVLFEQQGRSNATSSALAWVLGSDVLPPLGSCDPPAVVDGDRLRVAGVSLGVADAVVVATAGDVHRVQAEDLSVAAIRGLDPTLHLVAVNGDVPLTDGQPSGWTAQVAMAQLAIAHELVGASRRMLDLATEHALERVQFGRTISGFQAVRHRLAETLVAVEGAEGVVAAAWEDGSPVTATMAKALAGRSARTAARHCQQVLAGIGFTAEHPFQRYVRRVLVLDQLLGSSRSLTRALGDAVLRDRALPAMLPL